MWTTNVLAENRTTWVCEAYMRKKCPRYGRIFIQRDDYGKDFKVTLLRIGINSDYSSRSPLISYNLTTTISYADDLKHGLENCIKRFIDSREILFRQFRLQNIRIHPGYYFDEETFKVVSVAAGGAS